MHQKYQTQNYFQFHPSTTPCPRRPWISICFKMFQFRTIRSILLNTGLFGLGILTTLVVISSRQDPIDLCDFRTPTFLNSKPPEQLGHSSYDRFELQNQNQNQQHTPHAQQQTQHNNNNNNNVLLDEASSHSLNTNTLTIPTHTNSRSSRNRENINRNHYVVDSNRNNPSLPASRSTQWPSHKSNLSRPGSGTGTGPGSGIVTNGLSSNSNFNNNDNAGPGPAIAPVAVVESDNNINDNEGNRNNNNYNSGQIDRSVSVNKLQLPFTSKMTRNLIYVVTPTYNRPEQIPELTRVAQALLHVNHLVHWVVVEDTERQTSGLERFLNKFNLNFSLLKSVKPKLFNKVVGKPRGVGARRAALEWLRFHQFPGIVYFADDDNTYDSDIFRQMMRTKRVSMWPVGLVTELGVSSPIVRDGKVVGFYDGWKAYRKFPVDMAGFAINLKLIHAKKNANMPWVAGYEEDEILRTLGITLSDIKPLANNCTEILVWHTKAFKNNWPKRAPNIKPGLEETSNLSVLLKKLPKPNGSPNSNNNGNSNNNNSPNNNPSKDGGKSQPSKSGFSFLQFLFGNTFT